MSIRCAEQGGRTQK